MNRLHCVTMIQRVALEGTIDPKDVFLKLRHKIPNGGTDELLSRKQIEALAAQSIEAVNNAHFPVERARLALDIAEGELRADILDGIAALDVSNPRDCRDTYELHTKVGSSTGEPTLREAIGYLEAAGQDVAALTAACDALYPPRAEDER